MSAATENKPSLMVRKLDVTRMPGIDPPGLSLESFSSGVNVIHGPNAAGKTRVAQALITLLWPDHMSTSNVLVRGNVAAEDQEWFVKVDGSEQTFERDGTSDPGPSLPPFEQRDRYHLALHDLIQEDTTDQSFAEMILQELYGGYDVSEAAEELGFNEKHSHPGNTHERAERALKKLRDARDHMSELQQKEEELTELQRKKKEAKEASARIDLLEQVLAVFDAREEVEEVQQTLNQFPEVMEEVTGTERKHMEQLQQEIQSLKDQRDQAKSKMEAAEERLETLDYPYDKPVDDLHQKLEDQYQDLKKIEREVRNLREEREAEMKTRQEEQSNFSSEVEPASLAELKRPEYNELQTFARETEQVRNQLESLKQIRNRLQPEEAQEERREADQLRRGCEVLENWLAHPPEETENEPSTSQLRHVSRGLTAILTVLLSFFVTPVFLVLLILPAGLYGYELLTGPPGSEGRRSSAQAEYQEQDLPIEPSDWTREGVRETLKKLHRRRAKRVLQQEKADFWSPLRDEYEQLQEEMQERNEQMKQLRETYGVAPDADAQTLFYLTNRLSRWKDAHASIQAIDTELEEKRSSAERYRTQLNDEFQKWDLPPVEDASTARQHLSDMKGRINTFREARQSLKQAREKAEQVKSTLPEKTEQLNQLFERLNLEPGDEAGLQALLDQRSQYAELKEKRNEKEGVRKKEENKLRDRDGFDPELLERDRGNVEREIQDLKEKAEAYDDLQERMASIRTELEQAKEGYEVEPAIAEKERAFDALQEQLRSDYRNMGGHVLAQYVQRVNTDRTMPEVYDRARELLAKITGGRYELKVDQSDAPEFRVVDTLTGEGQTLNQLSSGTRIQVLLSVRLAFCQQGEEHVRLPLFMDETLANADDVRARTIIESVLEGSRDGRQVFYFTAQGDEVAKWQAVADRRDHELRVYDLQEQMKHTPEGAVQVPDLSEVQNQEMDVPAAGDLDHETYGEQLEVPPLNPRQDDVAAAHLWYLIEDVKVLEELLNRRIERWGPFTMLLEQGVIDPTDPSRRRTIRRARERAKAVQAFIEQWRVGRHRPINRSVLETTDAVSDNFIEEVAELCIDLDGHPEKLVKRLREGAVSGFRSKKMDELETFLIRENYIDESDQLDPDLIRAAMISALDGEVFEDPEEEVDRLWRRIQRGLS